MKVLLFGASGMIGAGVLRACLEDPRVHQVTSLARQPGQTTHPKLRERIHGDFFDYSGLATELAEVDACLFCLGVSSAGLSEAEYSRITHDLTLAAARALVEIRPQAAFCYISAQGADASGKGRIAWARVKGRTENALRALPFRAVWIFRPGLVRALPGTSSRTPLYRLLYAAAGWLLPLIGRVFPGQVVDSRQIGQAMLRACREGAPKAVLEPPDIHALAVLEAAGPTGD